MSTGDSIVDGWLGAEPEQEAQFRREFKDLPPDVWVLLKCVPGESGAAAKLEKQGKEGALFWKLRLGFNIVGAEPALKPEDGPYGTQFYRIGIDEKKAPGLPGSLISSLRNRLFAAGVPEGGKERSLMAASTIRGIADQHGVDQAFGGSQAMYHAKCLEVACNEVQPVVLAKTYLRKGTTKPDGSGNYPDRVELGDFVDATPEKMAEHRIVTEGWTR